MARAKLSDLAIKAKRLAFPVAKKPRFESLGDGISLGYRRNHGAGTWVARRSDGRGGSSQDRIGLADDYEAADGEQVFTFAQAQARAFSTPRRARLAARPTTVGDAVQRYRGDLVLRGGDPGNAGRLLSHLSPALLDEHVAKLRSQELRVWRDFLAQRLERSTVNRLANALKAALNLTADHDDQILSRRAWVKGLAALPDASVPRNIVLPDQIIPSLVRAAYDVSGSFGLLVEVAAVTGARYSQVAGLRVRDLQDDGAAPRLMMPSSKKGREKKIAHRPVPIPLSLARRLRAAVVDRPGEAPLLVKESSDRWRKSDHTRLFTRAVGRAGIDAAAIAPHRCENVTIYALRHSSITRQLLKGTPIRVIAVTHDTSVAMIERNYSALLAGHSDAIARSALLDLGDGPHPGAGAKRNAAASGIECAASAPSGIKRSNSRI